MALTPESALDTVSAPGARDRGPRRIVAGHPGEYYYTDDHYRSFRRILEQ